jgi:thiamine-phosphate pyrophosphorylase
LERVQREPGFKVYLVTDRNVLAPAYSLPAAVEEALKGGVKAVQLREKDLGIRDLLAMAYCLRELTVRYGAQLFINDRVDIALAVDADGVHLGGSGMPASAARKAAGACSSAYRRMVLRKQKRPWKKELISLRSVRF